MRRLIGLAAGCFVALTVWASVGMTQQLQPPSGPPHPEIRAAMHSLVVGERHLQEAARDYGGHRVKAMELIQQAQAELRAGLEWDRTHEQMKSP